MHVVLTPYRFADATLLKRTALITRMAALGGKALMLAAS